VELSNLNWQVLYWGEEIGEKKVVVAQRKLSKLNPRAEIIPAFARVTEENIPEFVGGAKVVLDGLDDFSTRQVVNSACIKHKIPFIPGGVSRFRGLVTTAIPERPRALPVFIRRISWKEGLGVVGVIPAVVANLQALEAIKIMIGQGPSLAGKLLRFRIIRA
jgi:molybdopterin/thiamine biosynthesis adenylyltransferase